MSPPTDPFAWVGQTIDGKFRIESVVGEGGFGVVYRAFHLGLGEPVAVKCLKIPASLPAEDRERFQKSFLEEGRVLRKLSRSTPAVVQALDVGAVMAPSGAWTPYLVLEWLRGETLEDWIDSRAKNGKTGLPLDEAFALMEPAALALATAHEEGIAHRDVKPANLFLNDSDDDPSTAATMKVLDFGIAKVIADNATVTRAMEQTGQTPSMFTPHYGAPEQFNRRFGATGPWTDVFALALVLVELSSGKSALDGDDVTQLYIAATDPSMRPTPRGRGVRTSHVVEAVFQKALAIEPRARYSTARAFWDALREALAAPIEADVPLDAATLLPTTTSGPDPARTTSPQITSGGPKSASKAGRALAIAGAAAIVALGVGASIVIRMQSTSAPSVLIASRIGAELAHVEMPLTPNAMILVPANSFTMGSAKEGKTEKPAHTVTLTKAFYIDRTEVTASDYAKCVAAAKCTASGVHGPKVTDAQVNQYAPFCTGLDPAKAMHPINCVDRTQAAAYCAFVGKRLPTEAEWEYAARGKDERLFPWGNEAPTCMMGNFSRNSGECTGRARGTMEVGSFPDKTSPIGALDMSGNVWEWVADGWDPNAYAKDGRKDPLVDKGDKGILRGGSWDFASIVAKTTYRLAFDPASGHVSTGLRCARTAD